ncbi:hypothetical protein JCM10213_005123 [Rhodosporidiobolus nylandii]
MADLPFKLNKMYFSKPLDKDPHTLVEVPPPTAAAKSEEASGSHTSTALEEAEDVEDKVMEGIRELEAEIEAAPEAWQVLYLVNEETGGYESDGRDEDEFDFAEMLKDPEPFAQHQVDTVALAPVLEALAELKVSPEPEERPVPMAVDEAPKEVKEATKEKQEKGKAKQVAKNRRYADYPNLTFNPDGGIVVDVQDDEGLSATFFVGMALDDETRLSAAYLKQLDREKVVFAAAPAGFEAGRKYNLATREAHAFKVCTAVVTKTLKEYAGNVIQFIQWAEEQGRSAEEASLRFPVDGKDLMMYLSTFVGQVQVATIRRKLDSLLFWHVVHLQPFDYDIKAFRSLMRAGKNAQPNPKEKRPALPMAHLVFIVKKLDEAAEKTRSDAGFYYAAKAVILTSFFGMARLGELTSARNGQTFKEDEDPSKVFNPKDDIHGGCFKLIEDKETGTQVVNILCPWTKTKHSEGDSLAVADQKIIRQDVCPVAAIGQHLRFNSPSVLDPGFSYIDRDGNRKWMTSSAVVDAANKILGMSGRPRTWGHSFRRGGVNFFAAHGVAPDRLRQVGSDYMREQHITALKYMSNIVFDLDGETKEKDFRKSLDEFYGTGDPLKEDVEPKPQKEATPEQKEGTPAEDIVVE